ncbi:MAG: hypothetical protein RJA61_628 [Candidatus Parcubacteria bacterium]|jgi:prepilin-type N-terminal cleavage/methylation domain-containing protein
MFKKINKKTTSFTTGFSLIELMVVIGIMAVIATISLFNYSSFNSELALTNLAYEVALTVREAQVFGSSVKVSGAGSSFDNAYGVFFNKSTPGSFISFVDSNGDREFDVGEETATHTLSRGNTIADICRIKQSDNLNQCNENFTHITFLRPSLDARIELSSSNPPYKGVVIILGAPDNKQKAIRIQKTGQISVESI